MREGERGAGAGGLESARATGEGEANCGAAAAAAAAAAATAATGLLINTADTFAVRVPRFIRVDGHASSEPIVTFHPSRFIRVDSHGMLRARRRVAD